MTRAKDKPRVLCILGPTASGKTALALALAAQFPLEIVSVDSAQVYRELDIGTAKEPWAVRQRIPHHLIDICTLTETYSVAQFCEDAARVIKEVLQRNRLPVLVGGTMLYFTALQRGLTVVPKVAEEVRKHLEETLRTQGLPVLYQQLQAVDRVSGMQIRPTDPQRILRALEVYEGTGKPLSYWHQQGCSLPDYYFVNVALLPITTPRSILHERICDRFDQMLEKGFLEEVARLQHYPGAHEGLPALKAVAYRQLWQYLEGKLSWQRMREKALSATRQLAKRQLTWLRQWPQLQGFDFADKSVVPSLMRWLRQQGFF